MNVIDEKSNTTCRHSQVPIWCSYFNHPFKQKAVSFHFSDFGMFFLSDQEFIPGSIVQIQTPGSVITGRDHRFRIGMPFSALAVVKWCRNYKGKGSRYIVGVSYLPEHFWGHP